MNYVLNISLFCGIGVSVDFVKTTDSVAESANTLRVDVEIHGQRNVPVVVRSVPYVCSVSLPGSVIASRRIVGKFIKQTSHTDNAT